MPTVLSEELFRRAYRQAKGTASLSLVFDMIELSRADVVRVAYQRAAFERLTAGGLHRQEAMALVGAVA